MQFLGIISICDHERSGMFFYLICFSKYINFLILADWRYNYMYWNIDARTTTLRVVSRNAH